MELHLVSANPRKVLIGAETFPLLDYDLLLQFEVQTAYLVKGIIDLSRFTSALQETLSYYPLTGGRLHSPSNSNDGWYIRLLDLPIPVEVVRCAASEIMPADGVIQPEWKFSPPMETIKFVKGTAEDESFFRMRLTYVEDQEWTIIGLTTAHVIGDGGHTVKFWQNLSEAYISGAVTNPPEYDSRISIPPESVYGWNVSQLREHFPMLLYHAHPGRPVVPLKLYLSDEQINRMKEVVVQEADGAILSTQDCVSAFMAVAFNAASKEADPANPPIKALSNVFNSRGILWGADAAVNSLTWANAHWKDTTSLSQIAQAIRQSFAEIRDPRFLLASTKVMGDLWKEHADKSETVDFSPLPGWFKINSSIKFNYLSAHFGYPGRVHFMHTLISTHRYIKMFRRNPPLFPDSEKGLMWTSGIELSFKLLTEEVEPFSRLFTELLTQYGIPGPLELVTGDIAHTYGMIGI